MLFSAHSRSRSLKIVPASIPTITLVVEVRSRIEVAWPDALAIIAVMKDVFARWDTTISHLVGDPMSVLCSAVEATMPIATRVDAASPFPTTIPVGSRGHLCPESFGEGIHGPDIRTILACLQPLVVRFGHANY